VTGRVQTMRGEGAGSRRAASRFREQKMKSRVTSVLHGLWRRDRCVALCRRPNGIIVLLVLLMPTVLLRVPSRNKTQLSELVASKSPEASTNLPQREFGSGK
jgi:hypothetical protein